MHEHIFIQSIINQVPDKENVNKVFIELGELVGIEKEHLVEHLKDETNWNIEVTVKESIVKCSCGYLGRARIRQRLHDLVIFSCPNCDNSPEIIEGKTIKILKVIYN